MGNSGYIKLQRSLSVLRFGKRKQDQLRGAGAWYGLRYGVSHGYRQGYASGHVLLLP